MSKHTISLFVLFICILSGSCKKYLDTKSDQSLSTPSTLDDLQLILDNPDLNKGANLTNTGSDEYYVLESDWLNLDETRHKGYVWDGALNNLTDWNVQYKTVFAANTALFNLDLVNTKGEETKQNNIKGTALFYRAYSFYNIAQLYARQYDVSTATKDLGIPLRLTADFNVPSNRATVQQSYDQIIQDLQTALTLLPPTTNIKTRPDKRACHALLSRVYLQMNIYDKAKASAEACLQLSNTLLDYNALDETATYPLPVFSNNPEILFYSITDVPLNADDTRAKIDSTLYNSYAVGDLRKVMLFRDNGDNTQAFKGNYSGGYELFNGLAIDEIFLIRAECAARQGNTAGAMKDLNALLEKRWLQGSFTPLTASTSEEALMLILRERKKELVYRGTRWSDLRRLNKEPQFSVTLKRNLNGTIYQLPPADLRYILLLPIEVLRLANLEQNQR
ncbi:RagB/SusD family nutrient uptake outer membrane protein [Paraflavitalea soli]|uniref:RagB/SusD family nutrient uptake outer membrane protein n=1 Tax=Paraflavitalea soli TaxID=2315862 RepID=A0A3B7MWM8_9BACT|nr:RagB/SusD family nutrient uptake outer membrane protein [Paraflavitalea soli]AXY76085.1 RagB/SusD family nutrient uptake outer membrane protein [Paraflavitalea soli]